MLVEDILPSEYIMALSEDIQKSPDAKSYFKKIKECGGDTEEAEINYNIFAKWFSKRVFEMSSEYYDWCLVKNFMDISVIHYHTIMDRFLIGMNVPINCNLDESLISDSFGKAVTLRICSRVFVDWGVGYWPLIEATASFVEMMTHTKPFKEYQIGKILQALPGCLVAFPKELVQMNDGKDYLAFVAIAHEVDEKDQTEFISFILISQSLDTRVFNTKSASTVGDMLKRHPKSSYHLSIVFNILFYLMAEPDDSQKPSFQRKTDEDIILDDCLESIEIWRPGRLGANISHSGTPMDITVLRKRRPHWRKGHWRYYHDHVVWIKPIFINKHLT